MNTINELFKMSHSEREGQRYYGDETKEVPGYTPTRCELIQIVKYWADKVLRNERFEFVTESWCPVSAEMKIFARRRIESIRELLGKEAVKQAIDKACAELPVEKYWDWNVFLNGSDKQKKALREKVDTEYEVIYPKDMESKNTK